MGELMLKSQEQIERELQEEIEDEMIGRGYDSYKKRVHLNIAKGRESQTPYGINLTQAGLQPLSHEISLFCDTAWRGKPGPKAIASIKLSSFPDHDVVAYIAFKVILDGASQVRTAQTVAITIGQLLEDELRFRVFEKEDPRYFETLKRHLSDTAHPKYRRTVVVHHMNKINHEFEPWSKEDKLRIGVKLIELTMKSVGLVKLSTRGYFHNRTRKTYLEFTEASMNWIKRQRQNRLAAYPLFMPCLIQPRDWINPFEGGFYNPRLQGIKAVKTRNIKYLNELEKLNPRAFFTALNALQGTIWEINQKVFDTANYCWDTNTQVGCLIDAEPLPLPPKPDDIDSNEDARKKWRREASLIHDHNAHDRAKRFLCLTLLDTARRYKKTKLFHVYQADFTSRIYPVSGMFNPQGNDLARGFHRFAKGAPIKDKDDADWLAIAGANHWGLNKCNFKERIEWAEGEGSHLARQIAGNPDSYASLWGKAEEPFQFLSWCLEWNAYQEKGFGFISKHPVLLDGTNNGYQHFAALTRDKDLANRVNLSKSDHPRDLYEDVKDLLINRLSEDTSDYGKDWFNEQNLLTRKLIKKPTMMIPYSGTTYGIAHEIKDYLYSQQIEVPWGDSFQHYYFLSLKIREAVAEICPASTTVMDYLTKISKCFVKEQKTMRWFTPSGFLVSQDYFKSFSKQIKTKLGTNTFKLSLREDSDLIDNRKTSQGFPANFTHSLDAANVHLALKRAKGKGLNQFCTIHDCYGAPAGDINQFIQCAKESFVDMYSINVLEDLYNQVLSQLKISKEIPKPPSTGEFEINDALDAPYIFS